MNDPRVPYWDPLRVVAKLRAYKTDNNTLLLRLYNSGHTGGTGEHYLKEVAFKYAWIAKMLNIPIE